MTSIIKYYNIQKVIKRNTGFKRVLMTLSKKKPKITAELLTAAYKSKVIKIKIVGGCDSANGFVSYLS